MIIDQAVLVAAISIVSVRIIALFALIWPVLAIAAARRAKRQLKGNSKTVPAELLLAEVIAAVAH